MGNPLANYTFYVDAGFGAPVEFKECSGITQEIAVIEHRANRQGALPVLQKFPGTVKYNDITLKRGKINDKEFWVWIKGVSDGKIDESRRDGSVILFNYERGEEFRINFFGAWPSKVSIGNLQAGGGEILVEEMTLVVDRMEVA